MSGLCGTCKKADVSCPVFPQDTTKCVEYSADTETINAMAARLRQIEIEIAEIRQNTARFGLGVNSPYCELADAGGLVMSAGNKIRKLAEQMVRA